MRYDCQHRKILVTSISIYNIEKLWETNKGMWHLNFHKFENISKINADIKVIIIVNNVLLDNIL